MARYEKQQWTDGESVIKAVNMDNIEDAIIVLEDLVDNINTSLDGNDIGNFQKFPLTKDDGSVRGINDINPKPTSFNDLKTVGYYYLGQSLTDHPYGESGPNGFVSIIQYTTGYTQQSFFATNGIPYFRVLYNNTWSPWVSPQSVKLTTDTGTIKTLTNGTDLNLLTDAGFFYANSTVVNTPIPGTNFTIVVHRYGPTTATQIATRMVSTGPKIFIRYLSGSTIGEWFEAFTGDLSQLTTSNKTIVGAINELKETSIEKRTSDPSNPAIGQIWFRTDL